MRGFYTVTNNGYRRDIYSNFKQFYKVFFRNQIQMSTLYHYRKKRGKKLVLSKPSAAQRAAVMSLRYTI